MKKLIYFIKFYKNIDNLKANLLFEKMSHKTYKEKKQEYLDRLLPTIYEVIDENDESMYDLDRLYDSDDSDCSYNSLYD